MLENQAFGWLKKSIMGGGGGDPSSSSTNDEEIAGCSDPSILVDGVARDFNMLLMMNGNTAGDVTASSVGGTNSDAAIAEDSSVTKAQAATEEDVGAPTTSSNTSSTANGHLNALNLLSIYCY